MRSLLRKALGSLVTAMTVLAFGTPALAAGFPDHALRIIVPYSAGGATDATARMIGQPMSERLGQAVIVENKPGANSNIGMEFVAKSAPDGYTILLAANSLVTNNILFPDLAFDGLRDFTPIARIASAPLMIAVPEGSPFQSLKELLAEAKRTPGKLTYASSGNGSSSHLAGEALKQMAGVDLLHVPYKGASSAITDLIGGRISLMPMNTIEGMSLIKGGKVRILAVAAEERVPQLPDVPTTAQAGLPGYVESVWYGLVVPAAVPADAVAKLRDTVRAIQGEPAFRQKLIDLGATPDSGDATRFAAFLQRERERVAGVVKTANIKVQ